MCCLKYEQDAYEDLLRTSPKAESFVDTPEGRGTVTEVDLLRQRVKVRMEDHPEEILVFQNTEIAVLRNGKAKKNDPPIPADLAPISGSGKRVRKEEPRDEESVFLDPIRFRYSTEAVVEEEEPEEVLVEESQEGEVRRNSRRRRRRSKEGAPKEAKEAPAEVKPVPKQEKKAPKPEKKAEPKETQEPKADAEGKKASYRRRPGHRRRSKPKQNAEE